MGYKIKKFEVRAAAALSGAASSAGVNIRGAAAAWFELSATDAGTLTAAGTKIEVSNDSGANWVNTGTNAAAPTAKSGQLASVNTGVAVTALNAGPAIYPLVNIDPVTGGTNESRVIRAGKARVTATPTTTVAGFRIVAYVAYEYDGPTFVYTVTNDEGAD